MANRQAKRLITVGLITAAAADDGRDQPYVTSQGGAPGLVLRDADGILSVIALTLGDGRISAIDVVRDPGKLTGVADMLDRD